MNIRRDLAELVAAGVLTRDDAERIGQYYTVNRKSSAGRMMLVFGILGAILVGMGIILIVAHNWDDFSKITKTCFAFLPMLIGHSLCFHVLANRPEATVLRESGSVFLFFAMGASIALVSQVYNIPGNFTLFLETWMLLCVPLIYLVQSGATSLLYIVGITYYACNSGYWNYPTGQPYFYWVLLLLILPYYYRLYQTSRTGNFIKIHNLLIPLSVVICLGTMAHQQEAFMFVAYMNLFGLLFLLGNSLAFRDYRLRENGYLLFGSLGTVVLLMVLTFDWPWAQIRNKNYVFSQVMASPEGISSLILAIAAIFLLILQARKRKLAAYNPFEVVFILFILIFSVGLVSPAAVAVVNVVVLALGILTVRKGALLDHLGILNYGLLIIATLVTCRFFDADLNFILRGIVFLLVGIGFFLSNVWILKKRKENA